jgi:hypothetical protein
LEFQEEAYLYFCQEMTQTPRFNYEINVARMRQSRRTGHGITVERSDVIS